MVHGSRLFLALSFPLGWQFSTSLRRRLKRLYRLHLHLHQNAGKLERQPAPASHSPSELELSDSFGPFSCWSFSIRIRIRIHIPDLSFMISSPAWKKARPRFSVPYFPIFPFSVTPLSQKLLNILRYMKYIYSYS